MIEILCGLLRPSAVGASSDCGCAYEVLPGGVHPERRYFHEPDCPLVGASKPEPVRTEGGVPHPEALVRLYIHAHTQSPWRAEALEALDVLVGRLEQAERTVTNLEQAFTAAREDLEQKDEALRWFASEDAWDVPTTILKDGRFGFNSPPGSVYSTPWGVAREALGTRG
jgi:hypothetical protein